MSCRIDRAHYRAVATNARLLPFARGGWPKRAWLGGRGGRARPQVPGSAPGAGAGNGYGSNGAFRTAPESRFFVCDGRYFTNAAFGSLPRAGPNYRIADPMWSF